VLPVALEEGGPFVQRADGFGVSAVELLATLAAHADEADVAQYAEVLGDGGLFEAEGYDDVADGAFGCGEIDEDFAAAGSATALKASEVVLARAMRRYYIPI
jgi:hypothetical protein